MAIGGVHHRRITMHRVWGLPSCWLWRPALQLILAIGLSSAFRFPLTFVVVVGFLCFLHFLLLFLHLFLLLLKGLVRLPGLDLLRIERGANVGRIRLWRSLHPPCLRVSVPGIPHGGISIAHSVTHLLTMVIAVWVQDAARFFIGVSASTTTASSPSSTPTSTSKSSAATPIRRPLLLPLANHVHNLVFCMLDLSHLADQSDLSIRAHAVSFDSDPRTSSSSKFPD
mmetsp:Transcript_5351/g.13035  ORF Transcript_5351/g.13035 Transcript_5351/m.13035 type:complete len:226 (+) Transcript_5351:966-1643(+)